MNDLPSEAQVRHHKRDHALDEPKRNAAWEQAEEDAHEHGESALLMRLSEAVTGLAESAHDPEDADEMREVRGWVLAAFLRGDVGLAYDS